jgi:hypothetical protein
MTESVRTLQIEVWPIDRFVLYARNPRKNDAAVDRMCSSIREFVFKIPVLARSDGTVVDGHLRLKAARKLGSWPWLAARRPSESRGIKNAQRPAPAAAVGCTMLGTESQNGNSRRDGGRKNGPT